MNLQERSQEATTPLVVQFHAKWCAPCRAMEASLEKLATEFAGEIELVRIDVDEEPEVAQSNRVRSLPTLMIWKEGRELGRYTGFKSPGALHLLFESAQAGAAAKIGVKAPWKLSATMLGVVLAVLPQLAGWPMAFSWIGLGFLVYGLQDSCPLCAIGTRGIAKVLSLFSRRSTATER